MSAILSAEAALLHALSDGPGFGLDLIGRVRKRSDGRVQLSPGNTYPALERLRQRGLARSWTVGAGKGRPRRYFELTPSGIARAASERKILAVFLEPRPARLTTVRERAIMAARIEECEELSRLAAALRDRLETFLASARVVRSHAERATPTPRSRAKRRVREKRR